MKLAGQLWAVMLRIQSQCLSNWNALRIKQINSCQKYLAFHQRIVHDDESLSIKYIFRHVWKTWHCEVQFYALQQIHLSSRNRGVDFSAD